MTESTLIVFTGDKGGVGKSTLAVLMMEWLLSKGKQVQLVDADPNQTSKIWAEKCEALGYRVSTPDAPVTIVDTAGTSGASLNRYILQADIHRGALSAARGRPGNRAGVVSLSQRRTCSAAWSWSHRLTNTKEQRDGLEELRKILKETGRGRLAPGLSNRPAVYPPNAQRTERQFLQASHGRESEGRSAGDV